MCIRDSPQQLFGQRQGTRLNVVQRQHGQPHDKHQHGANHPQHGIHPHQTGHAGPGISPVPFPDDLAHQHRRTVGHAQNHTGDHLIHDVADAVGGHRVTAHVSQHHRMHGNGQAPQQLVEHDRQTVVPQVPAQSLGRQGDHLRLEAQLL